MKKSFFLFILAVILCMPFAATSAGSGAASLYNRGNDLYQEGKFEEAARNYQQALQDGAGSADLYYNLGNALLRSGELGPGILNYMRARRLSPRDPDIQANLEYAQGLIKAELPDLPEGPFTKAFKAVSGYLSPDEWSIVLCVGWWLLGIGGIVFVMIDREKIREIARIVIFTGLGVVILAAAPAAYEIDRDVFTEWAVIMEDETVVRSGPAESNSELSRFYEGMAVTVGQCSSGWCRVSAKGGFIGWVEADSFERL